MRLISYQSPTGPRVAGLRDGLVVDLNRADPSIPSCMKAFLSRGAELLQRAQNALREGEAIPRERLTLVPPVPRPDKILCAGLNYVDHAEESGMTLPAEPVIFNKLPSSVVAHGDPIVIPRASSRVDYEAELVLVIGRGGRQISRDRALDHVAAYCCGNDVSARDWQFDKPGHQWLFGKSFDTFCPFGPALTTADEIADPGKLKIQLRVNGRLKQDSTTARMVFSINELVSYISGVCTLLPGDLIFTGTPSGVGFVRRPPEFLKSGDVVEVEIENLGVLRNPVVAE